MGRGGRDGQTVILPWGAHADRRGASVERSWGDTWWRMRGAGAVDREVDGRPTWPIVCHRVMCFSAHLLTFLALELLLQFLAHLVSFGHQIAILVHLIDKTTKITTQMDKHMTCIACSTLRALGSYGDKITFAVGNVVGSRYPTCHGPNPQQVTCYGANFVISFQKEAK